MVGALFVAQLPHLVAGGKHFSNDVRRIMVLAMPLNTRIKIEMVTDVFDKEIYIAIWLLTFHQDASLPLSKVHQKTL